MDDLTILYYTANIIPDYFMHNVQKQLVKAVGNTKIVSVSHKPMQFGDNLCIGVQERSLYLLYKQVLLAAQLAKTKYVATAEDDTLYPPEHFQYRPPAGVFGYDLNKWSIFTWTRPPKFSKRKDRRTMNCLTVERDALVATLEERYNKYPTIESIPADVYKYFWGEPGRFEDHLQIVHVETEKYECKVPSIMFSTPEALGFQYLGTRKAHTAIQARVIKEWGTAEEILKLYAQV